MSTQKQPNTPTGGSLEEANQAGQPDSRSPETTGDLTTAPQIRRRAVALAADVEAGRLSPAAARASHNFLKLALTAILQSEHERLAALEALAEAQQPQGAKRGKR